MIEQTFLNVLAGTLWSILLLFAFLKFFLRLKKDHYRKAIVFSGGVLSAASIVHAPSAVFAQVEEVDSWKTMSDPVEVPSQVQSEVLRVPAEVPVMQETDKEPKETLENVYVPDSLAQPKYVVVQGDNLWSIAKVQANENENVVELWKQIISINTESLQSKNPNLIYPGEELIIRN